jgi:hypothetical protein
MTFRFKLGKTATETHERHVRVYGGAAVSRKAVYKWFEHFLGAAVNRLESNNAQVVRRLRQQMKTCRKSTK